MSELPKPRPLAAVIKELRLDQSQEEFAATVRARTGKKITGGAISQIERGKIAAKLDTIEAIADAGGVSHDEIAEHRLALARALLDEREVGVDVALGRLSLIEETLLQAAGPRGPREVAPAGSSGQPTQATRRAARKPRGA